MNRRPPIPAEMKRSIRKRCKYGCVICGRPIYEYHHINGFQATVGHIETEITILCDSCHRKTTNGIISLQMIISADAEPFNRAHSTPDMAWMHRGSATEIKIGSSVIECKDAPAVVPFMMDGNPICFVLKDNDHWLLNLTIYDEHDHPIIAVRDNELMYRTTDVQDIKYQGGVFTICRNNKTCFRAAFKPPKFEIIEIETWWNGIHLDVKENQILINKHRSLELDNCKLVNCSQIITIGRNPLSFGSVFLLGAPTRLIYLLGTNKPSPFPEAEIPIKDWSIATTPLVFPKQILRRLVGTLFNL